MKFGGACLETSSKDSDTNDIWVLLASSSSHDSHFKSLILCQSPKELTKSRGRFCAYLGFLVLLVKRCPMMLVEPAEVDYSLWSVWILAKNLADLHDVDDSIFSDEDRNKTKSR